MLSRLTVRYTIFLLLAGIVFAAHRQAEAAPTPAPTSTTTFQCDFVNPRPANNETWCKGKLDTPCTGYCSDGTTVFAGMVTSVAPTASGDWCFCHVTCTATDGTICPTPSPKRTP
jgi:hypothetical protein